MEEKVLCRADIRARKSRALHVLIIVTIVIALGFALSDTRHTLHTDYFVWFGKLFDLSQPYPYYFDIYTVFDDHGTEYVSGQIGILVLIVLFIIPLFFFIRSIVLKWLLSRCSLVLTEKQIYGEIKWWFKSEKLQMPMEKLDNVIIRHGFSDVINGGNTIRISSNSGAVNFHCVQNAQEFTDLALKQLELFRKNNESSKAIPVASADGTIVDKMQSLQKLKEQGILSEAEFESKKAELLEKL